MNCLAVRNLRNNAWSGKDYRLGDESLDLDSAAWCDNESSKIHVGHHIVGRHRDDYSFGPARRAVEQIRHRECCYHENVPVDDATQQPAVDVCRTRGPRACLMVAFPADAAMGRLVDCFDLDNQEGAHRALALSVLAGSGIFSGRTHG